MFPAFFSQSFFQAFLLLWTAVFIQTPVPAQSVETPSELAIIDQEVLDFMVRWKIPGATVALAQGDKLLYAQGFGKADAGQVMTTDKLFRIASLSKPLTAMAVMKLVQDSTLTLDSKVFGASGILQYAPYTTFSDPRLQQITVQNLLEHSAGWDRDESPEGDPMFSPVKIAEALGIPAPADAVSVIRYMLQQPLDFTPGTRFAYSNLGYNILGRVIEEVTSLPYETYVRTTILEPLGITNMFLGRNLYEDKNLQEVRYFDLDDRRVNAISGKSKKVAYPYGGFNLEAMDAHGGWIASAPDLIKLMIGLDSSAQHSPLNAETISLMTTPSANASGYAKGWFVNRKGNWWHTGALVGSATLMAHLNNGMKWVLLLNARPEDPGFYRELDRLMWNAVAKVETWPNRDLFQPDVPQMAQLVPPMAQPEIVQ